MLFKNKTVSLLIIGIISIIVFLFGLIFFIKREKELESNIKEKDKIIIELKQQVDSLKINIKEYNDYLIRKKAEKISGLTIPDKFKTKYIKKVFSECEKHNVPPRLAFRLIYKESSFNKNSISSAGAKGFMQIMPPTYRGYSKKLNIVEHNEYANLEVGIFYLKTLHGYFDNKKELTNNEKWKLTILSYNYGIGKVGKNKDKFLAMNNYKYVNFILS
jgi:soluble lytic murein transglycosylase-like protein